MNLCFGTHDSICKHLTKSLCMGIMWYLFCLWKMSCLHMESQNSFSFSCIYQVLTTCPHAVWSSGKTDLLLFSCVLFWVTPWNAIRQASLSFTVSWSLLKLMSIESVMLSNHLILCHTLLLLPSIFPSIRVFSNELALPNRWPKYWSFSFSISPSNEY